MKAPHCTKGPDGSPCGNARRGRKTSDQCPRCWIGLHTADDIAKLLAATPKKITFRKTPLPLAHPDRCEHLGSRTEFRTGCNGWKSAHGCALGLPAVPGGYCQSCDKYEVDPDYAGRGKKGWLV